MSFSLPSYSELLDPLPPGVVTFTVWEYGNPLPSQTICGRCLAPVRGVREDQGALVIDGLDGVHNCGWPDTAAPLVAR